MLEFDFDLAKTVQATAFLLRLHRGPMDRMRLLKLLYIADRELLAETGQTLTGDQPFAMDRGPVLSTTYRLVNGERVLPGWSRFLGRDGYMVVYLGDPGDGDLTPVEEEKLTEVTKRYHDVDTETLSDLTHKFKEWASAYESRGAKGSHPMDWETAMAALDVEDAIPEARRMLAEHRAADALFGG